MRNLLLVLITLSMSFPVLLPRVASAADFTCKGERVEKSGSTKYRIRVSGSGFSVEKSGSTRGRAVKRTSKWSVEVSGATKARFDHKSIYRSGATWASIADAQRVFDCKPEWAATLWVLQQVGQL